MIARCPTDRRRAHALGVLAAALALLPGCGREAPPSDRPAAVASAGEPAAPAPDSASDEAPRLALWVLAEGSQRVLEDDARTLELIEAAQRMEATDLFVQVYRAGRAWYDAELADAAPYRARRETTGEDGLANLIALAHTARLRVHAWVNVLSLSTNARAPILDTLGREAVLVDRRGRSLLDYPGYDLPEPDRRWYRLGTPGIYLDPAAPGVREHLVAVFDELIARYPALDGLHLDYIRHPGVLPLSPGSRFGVGLDFGYGDATRLRFQRETGLAAPREGHMVNTRRWDAWKREQVSALVAEIAATTRARRPGLEISAAVIAYLDRAYLTLAQDWMGWIERGLVDFCVPMVYTLDDRLLRYQVEHFAGAPRADRIWAGLGTWLFASRPERAQAQARIAAAAGVRHLAYFSYDGIAERAPAEREALWAALALPAVRSAASPDPAAPSSPTAAAAGARDGR